VVDFNYLLGVTDRFVVGFRYERSSERFIMLANIGIGEKLNGYNLY
jgi:hypothetical protein